MTLQDTPVFERPTPPRGSLIGHLVGFVDRLCAFATQLSCAAAEYDNRLELRRMAELEDWQLRDLGVTRGDIAGVLRRPLDVSAAQELGRLRNSAARQI